MPFPCPTERASHGIFRNDAFAGILTGNCFSSTCVSGEVLLWQGRRHLEMRSQQGESHRLAHDGCLNVFKRNHTFLLFLPGQEQAPAFGGQRVLRNRTPVTSRGRAVGPYSCPQPLFGLGCVGAIGASALWKVECLALVAQDLKSRFSSPVSLCWVTSICPCKQHTLPCMTPPRFYTEGSKRGGG